MATDNETVLQEPAATGSSSSVSGVTSAISDVANVYLAKVGHVTNSSPTPPTTVQTVPALREEIVQGYRRGVAFSLTVVNIDGKLVEKNTAYDFLLMRDAARAEGIFLKITQGFRTYAEQERIRNERVYPNGKLTPLGERKGVAAKPGYSNHQQGIALDIDVKMTVADLREGKFTPAFRWLQANASRYGFDNTEVSSEPWHWRHQPKTIVGPQEANKDYLLSLVSSAASAAAASQTALKTDGQVFLDKAAHALTVAQERSANMMRTTRDTLYANMGRASVLRAAAVQALASAYEKNSAELAQKVPTISAEASKAVAFDFTTGTWGDGRST